MIHASVWTPAPCHDWLRLGQAGRAEGLEGCVAAPCTPEPDTARDVGAGTESDGLT